MQRLDDIKKKRVIDSAIEVGMAGRKNSNVWQKRFVAAAAVVMIGIPVLGFTFPALAQHIPIIGGIFGREDLHQQERFVEMADDVLEIGQTQEQDGFAVTLSEVFIDGGRMYVAYHIESTEGRLLGTENEIADLEDQGLANDELVSFGNDMPIFVSGSEINTSQSIYETVAEDRLSKTVIFGVEATEISEGDLVTAKLIGVSRPFGGIGVWDFEFGVPAFAGDQFANRVIRYNDQEVELHDITLSSSGLTINTRGEFFLSFIVRDDLGNTLESMGGSGGGEDGVAFTHDTFGAPHEDASQIIIMPHLRGELVFRVPEDAENLPTFQIESDEIEDQLAVALAEILINYAGEEVTFESVGVYLENNRPFVTNWDADEFTMHLEDGLRLGVWGDNTLLSAFSEYVFPGNGIEPIILNLP